jgi:F-type H+-transporting ATPase subunit b
LLANETRDKLNAEADEARRRLEAALDIKLADAEKTIAATKTAAMANVHGIAVETAAMIVERLIGVTPAAKAVESAVAGVLKR